MYLSLAFLRKNPNLTREEFEHYWKTVHAPMCRDILGPFGLRRYTACFPIESSAQASDGAGYDAIVQLGFDTQEALEQALASPEFAVEQRRTSSAFAFDMSVMLDLVAREHDALG